jgi:hypothetical protein
MYSVDATRLFRPFYDYLRRKTTHENPVSQVERQKQAKTQTTSKRGGGIALEQDHKTTLNDKN